MKHYWQHGWTGDLRHPVFGAFVTTGTVAAESCVIEIYSATKRIEILHFVDNVETPDISFEHQVGNATLITTIQQTFTDGEKQRVSGPRPLIAPTATLVSGRSTTNFDTGDSADHLRII